VLCLEWLDPPWVAGHWMPEIVDLAGGQDVLASPGAPSRRVSWPEIVAARPEAAIVMPCGFGLERTMAEVDVLLDVPEIDQLPSFRSGCVYAVDGSSYFNRPGPRLVEGLELLSALLHPEVFRRAVSPAAAQKMSGSLGGPGTRPKHLSFERVV
jgi:iron complex transport system substrate-binding protein